MNSYWTLLSLLVLGQKSTKEEENPTAPLIKWDFISKHSMRNGSHRSLLEFCHFLLSLPKGEMCGALGFLFFMSTLSQKCWKIRCVHFLGFSLFWYKKERLEHLNWSPFVGVDHLRTNSECLNSDQDKITMSTLTNMVTRSKTNTVMILLKKLVYLCIKRITFHSIEILQEQSAQIILDCKKNASCICILCRLF